MIDEYKTSITCSKCQSRNLALQLRKRDHHRAYGDKTRGHTIIRCTNNESCMTCWNRDVNASRNILKCLEALLLGVPRPVALQRRGNAAAGAP